MAGHLQGDPTPIRKLRPDTPAALEAVVLHAMRRYPEHRYPSAEALQADLGQLDQLDAGTYDLSAERPMGGMAAVDSSRRLWALTALIAVGFIGIVAVIIALSILLR
jgi:serine/threonine-protein kinase